MNTISIILISAACLMAAALNLAAPHRFRSRIMGTSFTMAMLLGLAIYGYGYACVTDSALVAVLRTVMAVCRMFGGSNDLSTIDSAPLFEYRWAIALFWAAHFMAFYATAGAAITAIGGKVLHRIRFALLRRGTLLVIYGVNANAVAYGKRQSQVLHRSVVYIGQGDASLDAAITASGGVTEKNGEQPDAMLLRRLGIRRGKRPVEIAALHADGARNYAFGQSLLSALEQAGILPEQTKLLLQDVDEARAGTLIATGKQYGYGSVMSFNDHELAARLMVQKMPPCDTIRFDQHARAQEDFSVLLVGFGRMGRAALDALLMNGQFCGSTFRADIFDANAQCGILYGHEVLKQYDIRFHCADGKSDALYEFLNERKDTIRYVVACTGNQKENREILQDIGGWLKDRGVMPAMVECTSHGLAFVRPGESERVCQGIYDSDALDLERIDRMAMAINHAYCQDPTQTPQQTWKHCDHFSRMSSRASADFYPAILRAAGKTMQQAAQGDWPPSPEMLENLAISEHMRWCAFHYVMGFRPMSEAEHAQRAEQYRKEMQQNGSSSLRIGKDMTQRRHACLIPWEQLDQLSARETAASGRPVDYKQSDRNNILALPEILAVLRDMPAEGEK